MEIRLLRGLAWGTALAFGGAIYFGLSAGGDLSVAAAGGVCGFVIGAVLSQIKT